MEEGNGNGKTVKGGDGNRKTVKGGDGMEGKWKERWDEMTVEEGMEMKGQ